MQETRVQQGKNSYYYESFVNDMQARDIKRRELKARWYKEIKLWDYVAANWDKIYFITWK